MITFTLLLTVVLAVITLTVIAVSIGGATMIVLFGDIIVCIAITVWIVKRLIRRKRK